MLYFVQPFENGAMKKEITIHYDHIEDYKTLDDQLLQLIRMAYESCDNAYAPYSNFQVGAVALLSNGEIVRGSNQENLAYPSGLCAERVALFYAGANFPQENIQHLVIVAKGELIDSDQWLSPCGGCRQVIAETQMRQDTKFPITLVNNDGSANTFASITDLLPLTFGDKS